jgi:hypothetical protein
MVGQDGDTGYPTGPDKVDRAAIKRSYKPTEEYALLAIMGMGHQMSEF